MSTTSKFLEKIRDHRESKKTEPFAGFLADYLLLLEKNKTIANLAHRRLYHQILWGYNIRRK